MANIVRYILRGDISSEWERVNPILSRNEPAYDMTNNRLKFGDGLRTWKELPYLAPDVIDELDSEDDKAALSANQGRVLKNAVDTKASNEDLTKLQTTVNSLQTQLTNLTIPDGVTVVDNLTSTSKTAALSANQGKVLNDNKADKSTVTGLQTTVNNLSSTVNSNTTKITNLQTTINNKANTAEVTNLQNTVNNIQTIINSGSITGSKYRIIRVWGGNTLKTDSVVSTEAIPAVSAMPYFVIPDGVDSILVSGCAGGGGLTYTGSGELATCSGGGAGESCHSVRLNVQAGDKISYYEGRGGKGYQLNQGLSNQSYTPSAGQDSLIYINGVLKLRLAGGQPGAGDTAGYTTPYQTSLRKAISDGGSGIAPSYTGHLRTYVLPHSDYLFFVGASDKNSNWGRTFLSYLNFLESGLNYGKTIFSPYGNGGGLTSTGSPLRTDGAPGCLIFEYVVPIS